MKRGQYSAVEAFYFSIRLRVLGSSYRFVHVENLTNVSKELRRELSTVVGD